MAFYSPKIGLEMPPRMSLPTCRPIWQTFSRFHWLSGKILVF